MGANIPDSSRGKWLAHGTEVAPHALRDKYQDLGKARGKESKGKGRASKSNEGQGHEPRARAKSTSQEHEPRVRAHRAWGHFPVADDDAPYDAAYFMKYAGYAATSAICFSRQVE
jgi:hypothetical protein